MDFVRSVMGKSSRIMAFNLRDIVFDWEIQSPEDEARLPLTHRKVFNIIHNFLLDDSETAVDASTALHNLIPPPTSGHAAEYDSDLNMVRDMIFDIACQIPHTNPAQSKLVSLVRRLSRSLGYGVKVQVKGVAYHDGFSAFRYEISPYEGEDDKTENSIRKHENWQAFLGRLYSDGFLSNTCGFLPVNVFRDTFEGSNNRDSSNQLRIDLIMSAALWIIYAGQAIYNQVVLAPRSAIDGKVELTWKTGPGYKGKELTGRDRWLLWRKGFGDALEYGEANEKTIDFATRAIAIMDALDHGMRWQ